MKQLLQRQPYLVTSPWWMRALYPRKLIWQLPPNEKVLYLTFDDGPHPEATPTALELLAAYGAKATFFCIGNNVEKYPHIYRSLLDQGHRVGNHTHNHLNGWKTADKDWLANVAEAAKWIDSDLFRPPYGRITPFQARMLQQGPSPYRIVMWSVLSADFDTRTSENTCFEHIRRHARPGSIIVFHDSEKALPRMEGALRKTLAFFSNAGYQFKALV